MPTLIDPTSSDTTGLKNMTLSTSANELFTNGGAAKEQYVVNLTPKLTVPVSFSDTGEQKTQLVWTLASDV